MVSFLCENCKLTDFPCVLEQGQYGKGRAVCNQHSPMQIKRGGIQGIVRIKAFCFASSSIPVLYCKNENIVLQFCGTSVYCSVNAMSGIFGKKPINL